MPQKPILRTPRLESFRIRSPFPVFLFLALGIASALAASGAAWRPSFLGPEDRVCVKGEGCQPSCADIEPDSICAELTDPSGYVLQTCCIPIAAVHSSDPGACLVGASILREGGPIE